jgi:hypothetical protein
VDKGIGKIVYMYVCMYLGEGEEGSGWGDT